MTMPPLHILISGAGIAGNALAFWLSKLGHEITVIERFPSLRTTGLQLDLRGHGVEVMKRMGLEDEFRSKIVPEQGLQIVDRSGKRWACFPVNKSGKGVQNFTTEYEIMRGDLCRLLYNKTKDRVTYIFGIWIERLEHKEKSVKVTFTNREASSFGIGMKHLPNYPPLYMYITDFWQTKEYDLLVGADGQGSNTRKLMFKPDILDAFHPLDGLYTGYFTIPKPIQKDEEYMATMYIAPGRRSIMTRRHNAHELQVYIGGKNHEILREAYVQGVFEQKEALAEIFEGAGWETKTIIEAMKKSDNFYLERIGIVKINTWSHGHGAVVGDAAYCPSAVTGMGTTPAMVGAYILAGEIGTHCGHGEDTLNSRTDIEGGIVAALKTYESKFRPFTDQVQRRVLEDKGNGLPESRFGIAIFLCLAGVASVLRLNVAEMFLKEKVKGWDLPDYEMLRE